MISNAPTVVVLIYSVWQSWFGGRDDVIGRSIQVGSRPATVIGVMPQGFYFRNRQAALWAPLRLDASQDRRSYIRSLYCVGRLKSGISIDAAQTEMAAIAHRLEQANPQVNANWTVSLEPVRDSMVRDIRTSLLVLLGSVGLLLAITCANVANLMLARVAARRKEMSVRVVVGAGRWRMMRQLLTESLVLGIFGGAIGLALATQGVTALLAIAPRELTRNAEIFVDWRIVLFSVVFSLLTALAFG